MPYLTLYRFTTDFSYYSDKSIHAISAAWGDQYDSVFPAMGFDNVAEYIDSYPSKFLRKSECSRLMNLNTHSSAYSLIQSEEICVNLTTYRYDAHYAIEKAISLIPDNILHGFVFLFPTINELLDCEGITASTKGLPFCIDWKG